MSGPEREVGLDRRLDLNWMDTAALEAAAGTHPDQVRALLREVLTDQVKGDTARRKAITILMRVWVTPTAETKGFFQDAWTLVQSLPPERRLPIHWGMTLAAYPFFRVVAASVGRLLELQSHATLAQITRRVVEEWGDRSTVTRAARRVVRTFIDWGVLEEVGVGAYSRYPAIGVPSDSMFTWLLEAALRATGSQAYPFYALRRSPFLFPFEFEAYPPELRGHSRIELVRQGMNDDVIAFR